MDLCLDEEVGLVMTFRQSLRKGGGVGVKGFGEREGERGVTLAGDK